ncbi:hypothetical protein KL864_33310 [Mycolicibacterium goodii]|uniref:hypothetical protein n=1 Tax=Mycolicibacterium goodii TaxID=134601 RepID=UPI001BDBCBF2|nr:hypothetical protein [Mycolicibacterium goodii]MBU8820750.1 hypothetical protein [Mycolicibacterium goodii]
MLPGIVQIIANGTSTDHPVPGLAFVDDTHIPTMDPDAIEAIGRNRGTGRHGRCDSGHPYYGPANERQWWAGTTEPDGTDLAWCVRHHPAHGRSVVLVRNADAWYLHQDWAGDDGPLLFRSGGYWWDGQTWYRPMQIFDWSTERYARRKVPGAQTATAADILAAITDPPGHAEILTIRDVHRAARNNAIEPMTVDNWTDHLRLWAGHRRAHALPLTQCVVALAAPELAGDQLIGTPDLAALAGIAPSTLRAYSTRGEIELPADQAVIAGRKMWSRPVAADWVESRNRQPDNIAASMAGTTDLSKGQLDLQERLAARFFNRLWATPFRKQWRLKNEETARQRATELASVVATNIGDIVPTKALRDTIGAAVLGQLRQDQDHRDIATSARTTTLYPCIIPGSTSVMLDWLVRHHPTHADDLINYIIRQAREELNLPAEETITAIRRALDNDGKLSTGEYEAFLDRVLPPAAD